MSIALRFLTKPLQAWRAAGQEREVLLTLLNKPGDHLLRDAGMTREDAANIVCLYRLRRVLLSRNHPIEHRSNLALWLQSERDILS
jgi:uncharacterized protein YjiS (DUF1127 family)